MFIKYRSEITLCVACAFALLYPPLVGALVLLLAMGFLVVLSLVEKREDPEMAEMKSTLSDLKSKVDRLILGRK